MSATSLPPVAELSDEELLRQIFRRDGAAPLSTRERLSAFVDWLVKSVGAQACFVADADGLLLVNRDVPETYVIATVSLSHAEQGILAYLPRHTEGTTTMELDDNSALHILRADTSLGKLIVGLIVPSPLSRAKCAQLRRLLHAGSAWETV
ncbi:MAG: hypothetical protein R3B48_10295 [Kofleriaceae bacterium]